MQTFKELIRIVVDIFCQRLTLKQLHLCLNRLQIAKQKNNYSEETRKMLNSAKSPKHACVARVTVQNNIPIYPIAILLVMQICVRPNPFNYLSLCVIHVFKCFVSPKILDFFPLAPPAPRCSTLLHPVPPLAWEW